MSVVVLYRFVQICLTFVIIFVICEIGHRVSKAFEETDILFDRLHWYSFPIEMWHMLPTVFAAAQEPIVFNVFGSISCSREDFKKVS